MADQGTIREIVERNIELLALQAVARAPHLRHPGPPGRRPALRDRGRPLAARRRHAGQGGRRRDARRRPACSAAARWRAASTIGIAIWAARLGVPIDALEVEVQADFDARGELGMGPTSGPATRRSATWSRSTVPRRAGRLDELLALAERHSPYLDVFGQADGAAPRRLHVNGVEA